MRGVSALVALLLAACGGATCPTETVTVAGPAPEGLEEEPPRTPAPEPSAPEGYITMEPRAVWPSPEGNALILGDPEGRWALPVIIGDAEAHVIQLRLRDERFPRPLTHDLIDRLLGDLEAEVVMVQVNKLSGGVFVGSLFVWTGDRMIRIDARTSDAVAIAIGQRAPIYVDGEVIRDAGIAADEWREPGTRP